MKEKTFLAGGSGLISICFMGWIACVIFCCNRNQRSHSIYPHLMASLLNSFIDIAVQKYPQSMHTIHLSNDSFCMHNQIPSLKLFKTVSIIHLEMKLHTEYH